ncbi:hypothetical protein A3A46_00345 [Candidatus Roizmanbacteria bacterium RIFCSPLOWO2_01_FULL_37_13]|nr:MAG: hypothetical protein A3A46_00345 [Candidatus Roizmanbacteria bacterium RIFCSPLOWO2_01_FULL_37_13]
MTEKQGQSSESQVNDKQQRQLFTNTVVTLSQQLGQIALDDNPGTFPVITNSILKSVPVLDFVTDGDLALVPRLKRKKNAGLELQASKLNGSKVSTRIDILPVGQVQSGQAKLDELIDIALAISFPCAQRLKPYLQITLPDTRQGLTVLKEISAKVREQIPAKKNSEKLAENFILLEQVLRLLEDELISKFLEDPQTVAGLLDLARSEAQVQLFEASRRRNADQIDGLKNEIIQRKMAKLKETKVIEVIEGEEREFSELDSKLYRIIEESGLADRLPDAREQLRQNIEQRKAEVIDAIVKRRAIRKIAGLMLSDHELRGMATKISGLTEEEILALKDDEGVKVRSRIASQLIDTSSRKLMRLGFTTFPNFKKIFEEKRQKLIQALESGDPFLFMAQLSVGEFELIRTRIPNFFRRRMSAENKALFALAKEELQKKLGAGITDEEILELFAEKLFRSILREFSQEVVDRAIQSLGLDFRRLINDPYSLFDVADEILESVGENKKNTPTKIVRADSVDLETKAKEYEFTIPSITTGKCQLVSAESLLRFGIALAPLQRLEDLEAAIQTSEFAPYFDDSTFRLYPPERKLEMIFSIVGRGAGSKLAGSPLFVLRDDVDGLETSMGASKGEDISTQERYGERVFRNSVRISPLMGVIGRPFSANLPKATRVITEAIDTVSANLEETLIATGRKRIAVEEATDFIKDNLPSLMRPTAVSNPGREVLQMDFFLLYPPDVRRRMIETFIETGSLEGMRDELSELTREGIMRASVFDISGGAGGVGITEFLARRFLGKPSGHMESYLDAVLGAAEARLGKPPRRAVIAPRSADLTLMNFEYLPAEQALRQRDMSDVGISTLELLQTSLESGASQLGVPTLKGTVIQPDTILKRFTFPNEGRGAGYRGDLFLRLPDGVVMTPLNSSRIVASDKRVNLRIVEMMRDELAQFGIDPIPFLDIDLRKGNFDTLSDEITEFMVTNRAAYPEIDFFGVVVKTGDKIPGRERIAGEVISAYPIPASVLHSEEMRRAFIVKKLRELYLRGVSGVIVQPNILSLVADNNGTIAPKFEVKMMAFARPRR